VYVRRNVEMELVPNRCIECFRHISLSWYGVRI